MEKLKAVEVAEIAKIQVNGVLGQNIFTAAEECIYLANLLKVVVELYWNGKTVKVYRTTTKTDILKLISKSQRMEADLVGALEQLDKSYKAFEHKGKPMTKEQVRQVLVYGIRKGYTHTGQLTDEEVDSVLTPTPKT